MNSYNAPEKLSDYCNVKYKITRLIDSRISFKDFTNVYNFFFYGFGRNYISFPPWSRIYHGGNHIRYIL